MKTIKHFLLTLVALLCSISANAYDFMIGSICYNITSDSELTVEVTSGGNYNGRIYIPSTINYNGDVYKVTSIGSAAFFACYGLTSVTIPNSVMSIGGSAFIGCSSLTSVTIPNSVTSIGAYAFDGCSGLTSVTIPNSVTSIGDNAFSYCSGLTSVTIPNSVISIGNSAFEECSSLTSITIPNSVISIGGSAFSGTAWYNSLSDGVVYLGKVLYAYKGTMPSRTTIVIKEGTVSIVNSAFYGCSGLTSVTIPNSVESIGLAAFCYCSVLTSVTIPNSVESIGANAFFGCSNLTSVTIPNSVTSIGGSAFSGTEWYSSLPDGVVYLGKVLYAYKGTMPQGTTINIKEGTVSIVNSAFSGCSGLTSVTIPNSVTRIDNYAFSNCSGLTSVTIPNSVTSIGFSAFSGCSGLTMVTIPNSVTRIENHAFSNCSGLKEVYCFAVSVPDESYSYVFNSSNIGNATLHVPAGSVEAYAATAPWSGFGEIVALPVEEVGITIGSTGATTFCSEYALDFTEVEGVKAYAATGYNTETGVVTLTRVKTAKAGTGLFIVGDEGTYSIPTIDASADNSLNMLVGTTEEVTIPAADGTYTNYIYGKSDDATGFFKLTGDKVIPSGKAYLQIPTAWFPAVAESKIKIEFEDGTTTGIDDVEEQVRPNDGVIYDLHGRVVKNPGKGIYIVNGKKVLF